MSFAGKRVYGFHERIEASKPYEERFIALLESMQEYEKVRKASYEDDKNKGIDLWVYPASGERPLAIQVKTDFNTYWSKNITFEVVSQAYTDRAGKIGWGLTLNHTDKIAFIIPTWDRVYIFPSDQYVQWCFEHYERLEPKAVANSQYLTLIALVPIKDVDGLGVEYKLPFLEKQNARHE